MLQRDSEGRGEAFNSRPYFRLCIGLISELAPKVDTNAPVPEPIDENAFAILTAFASAFHALQPLREPGFAFSWLELISHRCSPQD